MFQAPFAYVIAVAVKVGRFGDDAEGEVAQELLILAVVPQTKLVAAVTRVG